MNHLEDIIRIAKSAGDLLLKFYKTDIEITYKEENSESPVTQADLAADALIRKEIESISNLPILSEEFLVDYKERSSWKDFWLVDPLDGTKDFISHNDEFCVLIALIRDQKPVMGVMYAPALDELYYAEKGQGSFFSYKNKVSRLPMFENEDMVLAKSRFHHSKKSEEFLKLNNISKVVTVGSGLKFGRIARGDANIYVRPYGGGEWDIAPGHILLEEVGGSILEFETKNAPIYNKKDLSQKPLIALGPNIDFKNLKFPQK